MRLLKWLAGLIAGLGLSSISAQELKLVEEIRGGAALSGIELYPNSGFVPNANTFDLSNLDSLQFDILFDFASVHGGLGILRPAVGGIVNLRGRESLVHGGVNWQLPLGDIFYLEAGAGLAIHNGALSGAVPPLRNLGCPVLFHWAYGAGANITENMTLTANLQHVSNVIMGCTPNQGLNHFGVSLGYKF